jgi:hypothetical protein
VRRRCPTVANNLKVLTDRAAGAKNWYFADKPKSTPDVARGIVLAVRPDSE